MVNLVYMDGVSLHVGIFKKEKWYEIQWYIKVAFSMCVRVYVFLCMHVNKCLSICFFFYLHIACYWEFFLKDTQLPKIFIIDR